MNKDRLKHLPLNLFGSLTSFLIPFSLIIILTDVHILIAAGISFYLYLTDVRQETTNDYFDEKIKRLEDANKCM